ncbi:MAG TPA: helix-turn-helix transcriptional regulator [Gammaproteobacteria bacterium]
MSTINERIRILRESTGLGRTLFSRKHDLKLSTLAAIETGRRKPGADIIEKIVLGYPEYCFWLITGKVTKASQARPKKNPNPLA